MKRVAVLWLLACSSLFAQGTLNLEQIGADPSLWPPEVMVVVDHQLPVVNDGKTTQTRKVGPGHLYRVKSIDAAGVTIHGPGSTLTFKADDTDVIARAEQIRAQRNAAPAISANPTPPPAAPAPTPLLYKGALPFRINVPAGFDGPMFTKTGNAKTGIEKSFTYWKLNNPQSVHALIDVSISRLNDEDQALTTEALVEKMFKKWSEATKHDLQHDTPKPGKLGKVPTLEIAFKGKPREAGPLGEYSGVIHVFRDGETFYDVSAAVESSAAEKVLPELLDALQTVDFETRPAAGTPPPKPAAANDNVLASLLAGKLVHNNNGRIEPYDAANLGNKKYVAVYFSASWCAPCRQFTPELVEWYNRMKRTNDDFEVIFVSRDKSEDAMQSYMSGDRMPWPAVNYAQRDNTPLSKYRARGIPNLVVLSNNGSVLSSTMVEGNYVGPQKPLHDLDALLKSR